MNEAVVRLMFPAKTDYLLLARLALSGLMRQFDLDDDDVADLKLAVTEACGNAVRHAYPGGDGAISLAFLLEHDRLVMIVEDQGDGMPLPLVVEPTAFPLESRMGMTIISTVVDELDVAAGSEGHGTVVRMTKHLPTAAR